MKHKRDSATGFYISDKDSETRDKSTYVEETDFDKGKFLEGIFKECEKDFMFLPTYRAIAVEDLKRVFKKFGANLED